MTFAHPQLLWLLAVPALLFAADCLRGPAGGTARWPRIHRLWAGPRGVSESPAAGRRPLRWRLALGLCLLTTALARPQWGRIEERVFDSSREVLIALDLSRSMLAADVKPTRLDRARLLVESLLDKLRGERVGLVVFSGTAFLQSPLSPDYEVLRDFLPALNPDFLPEGGTQFDRLLRTALDSFSNEAGADRFLIVLSDGEAQDEAWRRQLDALKTRNIRAITLGVGTEGGSVVPGKDGGLIKDERGAVVMSKLNPATLRQLASATGGTYADASAWVDLPALLRQTIDRGKAGALTETRRVRLGERFQWFLGPALLLLLWSYWREFPVPPKTRDLRRPSAPPPLPTAALVLAAALAATATPTTGYAVSLQPPPAATPAAEPALPGIVEKLAALPSLSPADCSQLANATLDFGETVRQGGQPVAPGVVRDGLDAVDRGEKLNPAAADWPDLRAKLKDLLKPPPPKEDEQKQDEKKKDDQKQQDQKQQQQDQQQQEKQQDQQQKDQQSQSDPSTDPQDKQPDGQPEQKQDPPPPGSPDDKPPPTQKVGGESPPNEELRDNPQLAEPLQNLDQVRQQDKPATLYQLLHDNDPRPPGPPKKDW